MSLNISLTQIIEYVNVQEGGNILNRPIGCPALRNIIERNRSYL